MVNLPITKGAVRFAVGDREGVTSNSWKMWATKNGDVYLACRDNFTHAKVSLHASGRWRMSFTTAALEQTPMLAKLQNRAWQVWDQPPTSQPNVVVAFHLVFPASELAVHPEQRSTKVWKKELIVIIPSVGTLTTVTLCVTTGDMRLADESESSASLASIDIGNNRRAQLIAHGDLEGDLPAWLEQNVARARLQAEAAGVRLPRDAYGYFFGSRPDGSRFLIGARMTRDN